MYSQGENQHPTFLFPCEAVQKAWITRELCVRLNVHQVQGQITRGACDYSKDVIANRLHSAERITASRGFSLTDPTTKEGKCNLKQHAHHHLPKPWKLIDQEKDSSPTTSPPPQEWCPAGLLRLNVQGQVVYALLLSSAFKHSISKEDQNYNDVRLAWHCTHGSCLWFGDNSQITMEYYWAFYCPTDLISHQISSDQTSVS